MHRIDFEEAKNPAMLVEIHAAVANVSQAMAIAAGTRIARKTV
jgi:hypothetical protein